MRLSEKGAGAPFSVISARVHASRLYDADPHATAMVWPVAPLIVRNGVQVLAVSNWSACAKPGIQ
jgi:hypothetical protein